MTAPGGESPLPGIVSRHFVLVAGGTGGHLTPAYALAQELERRGHVVALITDARGAAIPGKPDFLPAHVMAAGRFTKNPLGWPAALSAMLEGRRMARALYKGLRPTAVVGFGGYPALPALLAANGENIPTVIHEQNAVLGRVNRLLASRVDAIATAYEKVARLDPALAGKVHVVGNPVRPAVLSLRDEPYPLVTPDGPIRLLVTGGSQGARILSDVVPRGLALLPPELRARLQVTQQCRPEDLAGVRAFYAENGIAADLASFFEDMDARLAGTHLFVGRAGASTIAELSAAGRPAILVPLPIATDDHQAANAVELAAAGGARSIRQHLFTPEELARQVAELAADPEGLAVAAHAAWNCGRPDAARDLADLVEGFGGTPVQDVIRTAAAKPATGAALAGAVSTTDAAQ
ncbi:undecaprenyldiphospho-muramoylpentapeptide beta-N-acetylglucosaminyltransferase [Croceibacterium mercuriale]|uniref:undecaprenyldiphospho-muramoylpentapeptide beta-N-acetylglucosaminyltransferase n=1 Tax=Croceibacterium mercuriale TaxID=1572751 RepID=UPI00068A87E0|nr:undecaprenyldiphospho-muramoylpentapeptide beta-N-acetylglucosaminyltransferase [Croceibacterium mercuriale]